MSGSHTALLTGSNWTGIEVTATPVIVTYSFPGVAPPYVPGIDDPNLTPAALASWQAFSASEQTMARDALAAWGDVSGLIFIEVAAGQGDINFQKLDFTGTGYAGYGGIAYRPFGDWSFFSYPYFNSGYSASGDVFMNSALPVNFGTLLHEIGHALGLKHPTEAWTQWAASPPVEHDVWAVDDPGATVMSPLSTLQVLGTVDVAAIQSIYGTQAQDGTHVASWSWNANTQRLTQIGFETADAIRGTPVIDRIEGRGGNDRLFGLEGVDLLYGGDGDDTLDGGLGNDRMYGGQGDDTYFVNVAQDQVTEAPGGGYDTIYSTVALTLPAEVEVLVLMGSNARTGNGNALNNAIFAGDAKSRLNGMDGDDYLVGNSLSDTITGGAGSDYMFGQGGADRFVFADVADFGPSWAPDAIGDFSRAEKDKIDLSGIDTDPVAAGDQAFLFVGRQAFAGGGVASLRFVELGSDTRVELDVNGDGVSDHEILLYGVATMRAGDFIL
ncbi:MAG: hypothetical protein KF887_17145 [Paracoccaceae bacterium]|nr:MAG: hypothetical protein KF887_17145 [Paracoccaceae bacterium]